MYAAHTPVLIYLGTGDFEAFCLAWARRCNGCTDGGEIS